MSNKGSTLFKIAGILAIITGAISCLSLLLIPGIPLIWGGAEFLKYAEMTDDQVLEKESTMIIWIVVFFLTSTVSGVLGLIALYQTKEEKKDGKTTPPAVLGEEKT